MWFLKIEGFISCDYRAETCTLMESIRMHGWKQRGCHGQLRKKRMTSNIGWNGLTEQKSLQEGGEEGEKGKSY